MTIIQNALSGALAAQTALHTTSQNVANVMTPGYTRQGALLSSVYRVSGAGINPGSGVTVPSLIRFSDSYKSLQMWHAGSILGQHTISDSYFKQLEQIVGNAQSSIDTGLDAFYAALNAASVEPTSTPLRQQVVIAADALAQRFNSLRQVLTNQRLSMHQQRTATVDQVNGLARDIALLNDKIAGMTANGNVPSGLIDERDNKIDALAKLIGVQVVDQPNGARNVSLKGGQPVVVGALASKMVVQGNADGSQTLRLDFVSESFILPTGNLGGQLGGLDDFESKILIPLAQSVTDMASSIASRINTQLQAGFALDGTPGTALFDFDPVNPAAMLKVRDGMTGHDLAFSSVPGEQGNSSNLLALIDTKDQPITVFSLGNVLMRDVYTQLLAKLGLDSQQNAASLSTARTVRNQAEESWKATSGVNTDEEAANLLQYQQMYQANMKVIAVANQLFDSTLAMFG